MDGIKVFEKGCFYCEKTDTEISERELLDCDVEYVVFDRSGSVGVVTHDCYSVFIHWIDGDSDEKYRVEKRGK